MIPKESKRQFKFESKKLHFEIIINKKRIKAQKNNGKKNH